MSLRPAIFTNKIILFLGACVPCRDNPENIFRMTELISREFLREAFFKC